MPISPESPRALGALVLEGCRAPLLLAQQALGRIFAVPRGTSGSSPARGGPDPLGARTFAEELQVEALDAEQAQGHVASWRDLAARALEPNAFLEPAFALPLARSAEGKAHPLFVAVWTGGAPRRLLGLFALDGKRLGFSRLWLDKQAALATPLLDRDCAVAVLARFFDWLAASAGAVGLVFPRLVEDGPVHQAICAAARATGREARTLEAYRRAALHAGSDRDELWRRGASKKALKDLRRRRRRLAECGALDFTLAATPAQVEDALEEFLALEASGWKAARGALLNDPKLATFARRAIAGLAREGKCRAARLSLDARPLAIGLVIESAGRAYFWKIAFDERFRAMAPGVDLVYELTGALAARSDIGVTDSCAIANHPMIDRFWPDRLAICDLAVALGNHPPLAFRLACGFEMLVRRMRTIMKRLVKRILRRKES